MKDLKSNITVFRSLPLAVKTSSLDGSDHDRRGFESVTFAVVAGAWTDGVHELIAQHRDEDGEWAPVDAGDLIGTMPTIKDDEASPPGALYANATTLVGYIGGKRYVRARAEVSGAPGTGAVYGVDIILGHAHQRPVL